MISGMKTTIDAAGRLVVPKALRQALGLKPGQVLEVRAGERRFHGLDRAHAPFADRRGGTGTGQLQDLGVVHGAFFLSAAV